VEILTSGLFIKKGSQMIKIKTVKRIILGISIPLILLLAVYIFISGYYSTHFYPGTWVNGINCSNKSVKEAMAMLEEHRSNYTLRIIEREGRTETLDSDDVGYLATYEGVGDVKKTQGMWMWLLSLTDVNFYTVESTPGFEEDRLRAAVGSLAAVSGPDVKAPENAYVDYTDGVRIIPEVQGTTINQEKLYEVLAETIRSGQHRVDIDEAGCYEVPEITTESEEFKKETAEIGKITGTTIKLHIGGDVYETIDENVTYKWLYQKEDGGVGIDEEKVRAYMKDMEEQYETWGKDHEFTTSYGSRITVRGGQYGWSINVKAETAKIIEELEAGESTERDVINDATAAQWGDDEIGDTYVEISIDNQHMWFYKNGSLIVDTDVVTGCVNTGHNTPRGTYQLNNKAVNVTLTSINPDDPYESFVNYWLPFIGNSYGLHDSSWRGSYGGSIYYYNGSHGCVNTPYSKIQVIYQNIEVGTPVVIY